MILEYGFTNFLSFRDEAYLDMHPATNRAISRYPNNYVTLGTGEKVLKTSVIVGENAGGKSNFVTSLIFLKDLLGRSDLTARSYSNLVNSANIVRDQNGNRDIKASCTEQEFSLVVALDGVTTKYEMILDADGIMSEALSLRKKRKSSFSCLYSFKRASIEHIDPAEGEEGSVVRFNYLFDYNKDLGSIPGELIDSVMDLNEGAGQLCLIWLAALGEKNCRSFLDSINSDLVVSRCANATIRTTSFERGEMTSIMKEDDYIRILRLIDSSIMEIQVDEERPLADSLIVRIDSNGNRFARPVREDSAGVGQFLYWSYLIYLVVYKNKTVVADEIDSAINPVLSDRVLAFINGHDHQGQFIFTTHNIFNLTLRTNMKEQINFVTKDPETLASSFYSLADFADIRYDVKEQLYEFYLKGALGGTVDA